MEAMYLLIPLSVLLVVLAVCAFFAMADGGQFDDLTSPALRVLHDDDGLQQSEPGKFDVNQ